ncbi:MAG: ATP-binding protein, partial [Acidobacteria bacterium]|nr:ATP-binding protein [Acidobacteriota bacterium]
PGHRRGGTIQTEMRRTDFSQVALPVIAIALISVMYYSTQHQPVWLHNILQHLYFAPIAASAIYFGWRGGIGAAILAALCYAPHLWIGLNEGTEPRRYIGSEAMEILDFFLVGLVAGTLADRERKQKESLERTTAQLNAVYQELQQNFERMKRSERLYAIGQLSAGLAHEVRNPLASIGGAAAILKKKPKSEERRLEFLEIIEKECLRLNRLLTNFLEFARPRAPQYQLAEVGPILESVAGLAAHSVGSQPIQLRTNAAPDVPAITCDPEQIKQVLLNLTINSVQAMPEGGEIVLSTRMDGVRVVIEVKDQGPGISPENLDRIFDPFFTTKDNGTGLGLSVAHQIVSQHGGILNAKNNSGRGVTFSLLLPSRHGSVL